MRKEKGITLIALVITIIVLLILAGVTIVTLTGNNGLFQKASDAKEKNEESEIYEQIRLTYNEWQTGKFTDNNLDMKEFFTAKLNSIFEQENVEVSGIKILTIKIIKNNKEYEYILKDDGNISVPTAWTDNGNETYTKGNVTLKIGDYINYKEPENLGYTGSWRVLGFENGQIKLLSAENVDTLTLTGKEGYQTGVHQLNTICEKYADDSYSNFARSIKMDDICELTGYDKTTWSESGYPSYGDTITYKVTNEGVQYKKGDEEYITDTSIKKFVKTDGTELGENEEISVTSNYFGRTTMNLNRKDIKCKMIFYGSTDDTYFTADQYVLPMVNQGYIKWGMMFVNYAGRNL